MNTASILSPLTLGDAADEASSLAKAALHHGAQILGWISRFCSCTAGDDLREVPRGTCLYTTLLVTGTL
jgi:hypothetical protein